MLPAWLVRGKESAKPSSPLPSLILTDGRGWDSPQGRLAVVSHVHTMSIVINEIFEAPQGWVCKCLVLTDISGKSVSHINT